ncbi:PAQR family membrane homeostasis protein TrhA [Palleronia sp. LCG004]|uniref:PAQR family membrane homeostasis protein TrhA n=1 Tax=Palleronia sp. LCG004 TaxID=3079304 RepID=UPI0029424559|nr:hemolysin III family protein [Palleronia sp. LCG004]WOI55754.1 hemolysin III family protein [Palleronia sp. LCG004]
MSPKRRYKKAYRIESRSDAIVHYAGLCLAALAVPALLVLAVDRRGDWMVVTAIGVYCATLLAMLGASAVYNITGQHRWTPVLKRLDHSAIYLKIAGSFTPLVALTGGAGVPFLVGLWGAALGGTSLKMLAPDRLRWLGLALYLGMGWVGVWAGGGVFSSLSPGAMWLIVIGGLLYTIGVAFFLWEALPYHTTIWHVFVLVATGLIYSAILVEVLRDLEPELIEMLSPALIDGAP